MRSFIFLAVVLQGSALMVSHRFNNQRLHAIRSSNAGSGGVFCSKDDGFGAQLQCKFAAFAWARHNHNICYRHTKFAPGKLHDNGMDADGFVGLKSDADCDSSGTWNIKRPKAVPIEEDVDAFYTPEVRAELRNLYDSAPNEKPELEKGCEVAIHARRGDAVTMRQRHRCNRLIPNTELYDAITLNFAGRKVCIFSEGKPEDFGKIQQLKYVRFILNGKADAAFHNLVMAPELVIAKSSFSYTAGILNQGKVYYIQSFWHEMLSTWTQVKLSPMLWWQSKFCETTDEPTSPDSISDYD